MDKQKFDLTQGNILQKLLIVAVPIMGTMLLLMTYNLTDMFWLGRLSSDAVAASGTAGMYLWLSNGVMMIGRMGAEIGVSQYMGRGDRKSAQGYAHTSLLLSLIFGAGVGLAMALLSNPLIGFFGIQEAHVHLDAVRYLIIAAAGVPVTFLSGAVTGTYNGAGNSRIPFAINAVGLVANMILDPLMIFGLNLGIVGAAIATVTAQLVVCVLSLVALRAGKRRPFPEFTFRYPYSRERTGQVFRWTLPIVAENILFAMLSMVIGRFVTAWGADAIAVQRVGSQIESLTWLIGGGFASAMTAFVGQNYGAGKWARIRSGIRIAMGIMAVWGIFCTALLFFAGRRIFSVFLPEEALLAEGANYLRILCVCQLPACLEYMAAGIFRGVGKTLPPSVGSVTMNALRIPLTYALGLTALGLSGLWWGISLGSVLRSVVIVVWYLIYARTMPKGDTPVLAGE